MQIDTHRDTLTNRHAYTHKYRQIRTDTYTHKHTKKQIHTGTGIHTEHCHYKASLGTYHFYGDPLLPPFASEQYQEAFAKGLKPFVTQWSLVTLFLLVPHSHPVTAPCRRALGSTSTGSASAPISPPHPLSLETSSFNS